MVHRKNTHRFASMIEDKSDSAGPQSNRHIVPAIGPSTVCHRTHPVDGWAAMRQTLSQLAKDCWLGT
jgi:hypothetical protein